MLVSSYSMTRFLGKIKVVASRLSIDNFGLKPYAYKKAKRDFKNQRTNNYSCVRRFKEKFAYNFNDMNHLLFCTLTIATYDNPVVPDRPEPAMVTLGGEPFAIEKQAYQNASDYEWASRQFHLFILRLKRKFDLNDNFKYAAVAELQDDKWVLCKDYQCRLEHKGYGKFRKHFKIGRKIWHFHFVASQFLPKHSGCPINNKYNGRTVGCVKCNWELAKVWKIGYCQKKETKITNGDHFANYMSKYMSKAFEILGNNKKAYRFSRSCQNVPVERLRLISNPKSRSVDENGDVRFERNSVIDFERELVSNCSRYEVIETEIKASVPADCYYSGETHTHKKGLDCFSKKIKSYVFWFTDYESMNWIKEQFRYFKSLSWKEQLQQEFKDYFDFDFKKRNILQEQEYQKSDFKITSKQLYSISFLKEKYQALGQRILQKNYI